jgi:hypothetical protein
MAYLDLANGTIAYTKTQAKQVIAGYAFGEVPVEWAKNPPVPVPTMLCRPAFSYRAYDCIPSNGPRMTLQDLLTTAGIESQINSKIAYQAMAVEPHIRVHLSALQASPPFWTFNRAMLANRPPVQNAPESHLWEVWDILTSPKGFRNARMHKVLHYKAPKTVPLVDSRIEEIYTPTGTWTGIWDDLNLHIEQFDHLESWFGQLANVQRGAPLFRLRLLDILLWTHQTMWSIAGTSNRKNAQELGTRVLAGRTGC